MKPAYEEENSTINFDYRKGEQPHPTPPNERTNTRREDCKHWEEVVEYLFWLI